MGVWQPSQRSLLSRLQTPFFKTWCKQNPLESVAGWPRVHRTALHCTQTGVDPGGDTGRRWAWVKHTQTWLFPFCAIRYTWLILSNSWTGAWLVVCAPVVIDSHLNAHKSIVKANKKQKKGNKNKQIQRFDQRPGSFWLADGDKAAK